MNTAKLHMGGITGVVLAFFMILAPGYAQETPPPTKYFDDFTAEELNAVGGVALQEQRRAQTAQAQKTGSSGTVVDAVQRGTGLVLILGGGLVVAAVASAAFRTFRRKKDSSSQL